MATSVAGLSGLTIFKSGIDCGESFNVWRVTGSFKILKCCSLSNSLVSATSLTSHNLLYLKKKKVFPRQPAPVGSEASVPCEIITCDPCGEGRGRGRICQAWPSPSRAPVPTGGWYWRRPLGSPRRSCGDTAAEWLPKGRLSRILAELSLLVWPLTMTTQQGQSGTLSLLEKY